MFAWQMRLLLYYTVWPRVVFVAIPIVYNSCKLIRIIIFFRQIYKFIYTNKTLSIGIIFKKGLIFEREKYIFKTADVTYSITVSAF